MRKNNKGFTLTELLAVITLIIILTSIAVVAVSRYLNGSRTKAFSNDTIVIAEAALNKYSDDRLQENFNNDLFAGSVDGKRCYSIESALIGKFAKTANDLLKGSVEVCYGDSCTYETKVWLTNGEFFIDGEIVDENTNVKSKIKDSFTSAHYSSCGVDIDSTKIKYEFAYTGTTDALTIPRTGIYKLEVWGASGQNQRYYLGGYGAYSVGEISLEKNSKIYITVGGNGNTNDGYNGGGLSNNSRAGGATHIATKSGTLPSISDYRYSDIFIVAGGGGAAHPSVRCTSANPTVEPYTRGNGGHGGGFTGSKKTCTFNSTSNYCIFGQGKTNATSGEVNISGSGGGFMSYTSPSTTYFNNCTSIVPGGDGGTGYIAYSYLTNKHMATYKFVTKGSTVEYTDITSDDDTTKTIATECVSTDAIADCAKIGDGYAKVTYLRAS